jgi:RNA polymerase sigma-70 factor (ECF subfamily)
MSSIGSPQSPTTSIQVSAEYVAQTLAQERPKYLAFIQSRLSDSALAEDILQAGFIRAVEKANTLRSPDALQGWFYGILRNAVIDAQRRRASAARALSNLATELAGEEGRTQDEPLSPCHCVKPLAENLKPEYRSALERIDVEGVPVKIYAEEQGLTPNHAGVRVHRARHALRQRVVATCGRCATAGCQNCTCEKS